MAQKEKKKFYTNSSCIHENMLVTFWILWWIVYSGTMWNSFCSVEPLLQLLQQWLQRDLIGSFEGFLSNIMAEDAYLSIFWPVLKFKFVRGPDPPLSLNPPLIFLTIGLWPWVMLYKRHASQDWWLTYKRRALGLRALSDGPLVDAQRPLANNGALRTRSGRKKAPGVWGNLSAHKFSLKVLLQDVSQSLLFP